MSSRAAHDDTSAQPGGDASSTAAGDVSLAAGGDPSSGDGVTPSSADASPSTSATTRRPDIPATGTCGWCASFVSDRRSRFCGQRCRQAAFRLRRRRDVSAVPGDTGPLCFAYADPPYPGLSKKFYGDQESYAGEVDHVALIASLRARHDAGEIAGWALSTAGRSLRDLLPLCPPGVHVAVWVKDLEVPPATYGPHYRWEAVIVSGGRKMQPGVRDWLMARPARLGGHDLPGRKPIAFCAWLFDLLGMVPGDSLDDMFPGTGTVGRAWAHLSSVARATDDGRRVVLSSLEEATAATESNLSTVEIPSGAELWPADPGSVAVDQADTSPPAGDDASPRPGQDVSPLQASDAGAPA